MCQLVFDLWMALVVVTNVVKVTKINLRVNNEYMYDCIYYMTHVPNITFFSMHVDKGI